MEASIRPHKSGMKARRACGNGQENKGRRITMKTTNLQWLAMSDEEKQDALKQASKRGYIKCTTFY